MAVVWSNGQAARLLKTPISLERNIRYEVRYLDVGQLLSIAGSAVVTWQLISSF